MTGVKHASTANDGFKLNLRDLSESNNSLWLCALVTRYMFFFMSL